MPPGEESGELARVLLVDDNAEILKRAAATLMSVCTVVGTLTDGAATVEAVHRLDPDVLVLDISMRDINGFEIAKRLQAERSRVAIVFLTVYDDEEYMEAARRLGAAGYVVKSRLDAQLVPAVLAAYAAASDASERRRYS